VGVEALLDEGGQGLAGSDEGGLGIGRRLALGQDGPHRVVAESLEVRDTFKVPKFGTIAGCLVTEGRITRAGDSQARLLRDNVVIYEGKIGSLRRFKDDASEVKAGFEARWYRWLQSKII